MLNISQRAGPIQRLSDSRTHLHGLAATGVGAASAWGRVPLSPNPLDPVSIQLRAVTDQRELLELRLRDQQPVKRVPMMPRQIQHVRCRGRLHPQDGEPVLFRTTVEIWFEPGAELKFAQAGLDRNLPDALATLQYSSLASSRRACRAPVERLESFSANQMSAWVLSRTFIAHTRGSPPEARRSQERRLCPLHETARWWPCPQAEL
jgi:hypothetical protein